MLKRLPAVCDTVPNFVNLLQKAAITQNEIIISLLHCFCIISAK